MDMVTDVIIRTTFKAFHFWSDAPEAQDFLRYKHRHLFYVQLKFRVLHDDRQVEFFDAQQRLDQFLRDWHNKDLGGKSCEMMSKEILIYMHSWYDTTWYCSVFEDNENGAEVFDVHI